MDPDELQPKSQNPASDDSSDGGDSVSSDRIFDISDDNISPISSEELVAAEVKPAPFFKNQGQGVTQNPVAKQNPVAPAPTPIVPKPVEDLTTEKRATPPTEGEMLDQKIGSFDASPFASTAPPAVTAAPVKTPSPQRQDVPEIPRPMQTRPVVQPTPVTPAPELKPTIPVIKPDQQRAKTLQEEIASALPQKYKVPQPLPPKPPGPTLPQDQQSRPLVPPRPVQLDQVATPAPTANFIDPVATNPPQRGPAMFQAEKIKPVRTYEGDVAEVMSHKRTSTASIAIAESKRQEGVERVADEPEKSRSGKNIFLFILSIILLGGGGYGAYYLYSKSALAPVTPIVPVQQASPSIIPSEGQTVLTINTKSSRLILDTIKNSSGGSQSPDSIKEIVLATKGSSGRLTRIPSTEMVKVMNIDAPDILTRSLNPDWMLGVYNDTNNQRSIFVVATTNFFQNTFAGMLQWEHVMADDLRPILYPENISGVLNEGEGSPAPIDPLSNIDNILPLASTTTATSATSATSSPTDSVSNLSTSSTPLQEQVEPLKPYTTITGKFEDRIVKNRDVRAFRSDDGQIIFLYSFIDNNRLVITDKESTLAAILSQVEKQAFVR